MSRIAAIVLAGGQSRRMSGPDKLDVSLNGASLLDWALAAVSGAEDIVVVGPVRPTAIPVRWTREVPSGSGPLAAIEAGYKALTESATESPLLIQVLAGDMPFARVGLAELAQVLGAEPLDDCAVAPARSDVALAVDVSGRDQPLLAVWRSVSLAKALTSAHPTAGKSVRSLFAGMAITRIEVPADATMDCDVPSDIDSLSDRLSDRLPAADAGRVTSRPV